MRYALVCPGRGSYTEASMGTLVAAMSKGGHGAELVGRAEGLRSNYKLTSLIELDGSDRFSPTQHLRPANVSALIYVATMLDVAEARVNHSEDELVGVVGNSMGWYTSLAVAGALSFEDGFRLVQEVALMQEAQHGGGQVLYPIVGADWRPDPRRLAAVESALTASKGQAFASIDLGGFRVLAGSDTGMTLLMRHLPAIEAGELGRAAFPLRLAGHGPYHTPLLADVAFRAQAHLADLDWQRPAVTLIDGRGSRFTPWSASPRELANYTLGHQITRPFDFTRSVRVTLRELAPDRLVLPGPGNTLGSITAQCLILEGWRGIQNRADFESQQASTNPILESMRR